MCLDKRMSDGLCRHKGVRHDAAEEITFSCNAKLARLFEADQRIARDEIDPASVARGAVIFALVFSPHQSS